VAGWPIRRSGPVGRLAAGGVGGAPRRAAAVSVVVALGVTLTAGVLVGGASIRVLADREAAVSAPADFELSQTDSGKALPAAAVRQARTEPALRHVTPYRRLTGLRLPGIDDKVDASDLAVGSLPRLTALDVASGSLHKFGPGKIVLSAWAADTAGLKAGDTTTVTAGKHDVRLTVAAVLPDMAPLRTAMILDAADLTALGAPAAAYSGVLADAAAGGERGRADGRAALVKDGGGGYALDVLADERDQINSALDVVLAVALGLIGLTVLVAVVGVGATTALSVVERIREAGLLRAVGLARAGLRTMLTTEAGLYGAIGAVLGLALGVPYAWLAVAALGVRAPLTLPVAQLAAVFAVLVALTAIAGLLPARRAARVSPVVALGSE
jgi:putative ABC transport system permease protein